MPGAARQGSDSAGGTITSGSSSVYVNGQAVARIGDSVASHGDNEHSGGVSLVQGSSSVFANGIGISRAGDNASCGHSVSPGSSNVIVG